MRVVLPRTLLVLISCGAIVSASAPAWGAPATRPQAAGVKVTAVSFSSKKETETYGTLMKSEAP